MNKVDIIVQMQNLQGRFVQLYNCNQLEKIAELFDNSEEVSIHLYGKKIHAEGKSQIAKELEKLKSTRNNSSYGMDILTLNTPAFSCKEGLKALWESSLFEYSQENLITYVIGHFDVEFIRKDNQLYFKELIWNELTAMVPWQCKKIEGFQQYLNYQMEKNYNYSVFGDDFIEIQKLQAKFSQNNRNYAEELFASINVMPEMQMSPLFSCKCIGIKAIATKLKEIEENEKSRGVFQSIPLISAPVITIHKNGVQAIAIWMCINVSIQGTDNDLTNPVVFTLGRFHQELVKEKNKWKFKKFKFETIGSFLPFEYSHNIDSRYDRMSRANKKWLYGADPMGGLYAKDVFEIESIFPQWTYRLRSGDQITILDKYLQSNERDIYKSLRAFKYSRDYGEETLRKYFVNRQDASFFTSMPAFHTATTPLVEVNETGTYAKAVWLDLSLSDLFKGKLKEDRYRPYAAYVGKYENEYIKEDGVWKMLGIGWEPLITLPEFYVDTVEFRGWMDWNHKELTYPKPFEKYREEE